MTGQNKTNYIIIGLISILIILIISMMLPAPYSPRYWVKRLIFNPTFECKDGVYSFAATTQGACSGHGGIKKRIIQ